MYAPMSSQAVDFLFAFLPMAAFVIVLIVVYYGKRSEPGVAAPHTKTYACAQCGRRGKHEHMVPITREGAVVWYCGHCAHAAK
jgi:hypothetical protein